MACCANVENVNDSFRLAGLATALAALFASGCTSDLGSMLSGVDAAAPVADDAPADDDTDDDAPVDDPPADDDTGDADAGDDDPITPVTPLDAGPEPDDDVTPPVPSMDAGAPSDAGSSAALELTLIGSVPAHQATNVDPDTTLLLEFDRDVRPGAGFISLFESTSPTATETVYVTDASKATFEGPSVSVVLSAPLTSATSYSIVVDPEAIEDEQGNAFAGLTQGELIFATKIPNEVALVSTLPELGDVDVPLDSNIVLTFNRPVMAGQSGMLVVSSSDLTEMQSVLIADTTQVSIEGATVSVDLPDDLTYTTDYFVTLEPGAIQSVEGAAFVGFNDASILSFSTLAPPEVLLESTTPPDGALNVDPNTPLVFTLSEEVVAGTGTISIVQADDDGLVEAVDVSSPSVVFSSDTVTVDPSMTLANATEYYVLVEPTAIASTIGSRFAGIEDPTAFSFITAAGPLDPLLLVSTNPSNGATDVARVTNIELTFSEDVRVASGNVSIYEEDGSLFESIAVTSGQTNVTGATATLDPGGTLRGNTIYYVLVTAGSFQSLQGASFAGVNDPNAIRFTTEDTFGLDNVTPPDDATAVEVGTHLSLTFSEPVEAGAGTISVVETSSDTVLETVPVGDARVSISSDVITVDLDGLLDASTNYHVSVDAGAFQQAGGGDVFEGISAATDWNFTTAAVPKPGSVSAGLVLWLDADYAPSLKNEPGVRFWADRSGQHNDVQSTSAAERPALETDAIGTRDVVRFDGTDDWLAAASGLNLSATEAFIVWQSSLAPSAGAKRSIFVNGENLELNHRHPDVPNSVVICTSSPCETGSFASLTINPTAGTDTTTLWHFGFDTTTTALFASAQGGALSFNPSPATSGVPPTMPLGIGGHDQACSATGGCYFDGDVGEIIVYSRRLTQAERLAVVDYLRTKWSVPEAVCSAGEVLGANGNCYYLETAGNDWQTSRDACIARGDGWDLAAVRSLLDHDTIVSILDGPVSDAYIGASDADVPNAWRWVTDTFLFWNGASAADGGSAANNAFTRWRDAEPSAIDEECARYNFDGSGWTWADIPCYTAYPSICQGPGD